MVLFLSRKINIKAILEVWVENQPEFKVYFLYGVRLPSVCNVILFCQMFMNLGLKMGQKWMEG